MFKDITDEITSALSSKEPLGLMFWISAIVLGILVVSLFIEPFQWILTLGFSLAFKLGTGQ